MARPGVVVVALSCMLCVAFSRPGYAQFRKGLGQGTVEVTLNRKRPPKVVITGTNIKIEVVSQTGSGESVAQRFQSTFETQMLANDTRLRTSGAPDTVVSCTISRLESTQTAGSRQVQVNRQVGTKQVWNEKKKTYDQQPNYQLVNETQSFTTVRGDMAVSIQVRDRKSGATLDSQSFTPTYNNEFLAGVTPPDRNQVEQWLINDAVRLGVARLTPTREMVKVMLGRPNDPIDEINKLAQSGLWGRMLEQLELLKPLADSKKEAYRVYNIGVANEALAYDTDDLATSKRMLEKASAQYGRALEMKPDEKYFREPQTRISQGLSAYAELERQQAIIAEAEANAASAAVAAAAAVEAAGARDLKAVASSAPKGAMVNTDVINLVAGGLDERNLLAAIKDATEVAFDLSPAGLQALLSGKVSNNIIAVMRTRQAATSTAKPKPPVRKAPAAPKPPSPPPPGY